MGRVAKAQRQARAKARQRRIALDHDRAAHDERVEAAAAEAILALGERDEALGQVRAADVRVGEALRAIIAEGIKVDGVARLYDLSVGEVHRLRRLAQAVQDLRDNAEAAGPDPCGSTDVTVRARDDPAARRSGTGSAQAPPGQPAATTRAR